MAINGLNSGYYKICCRINVLRIHNKLTEKTARYLQTKQNTFGVKRTMKLTETAGGGGGGLEPLLLYRSGSQSFFYM